MSSLTDEQKAELIYRWVGFESTNEEEEKFMSHFAKESNYWIAERNTNFLRGQQLSFRCP